MNKWSLRLVLLVALLILAACNREPRSSVSPVGLWQGTLTTTSGGSETQLFTAEVSKIAQSQNLYEGRFTVGNTAYSVTGSYVRGEVGGERFEFSAPPPELQAANSDPFPYGFNWSGFVTGANYTGDWFHYNYPDRKPLGAGTFTLERLP